MGDSQRLNLVVFGATGFTGKYTIEEVHRFSKKEKELTWGIAGRSEEKLKALLKNLEEKTGDDLSKIPVIIADISDEESLKKMAERATVVINCCGPYRFFGEPVVKACVASKTHHVDVSGEPQYMERMQLEYNKPAQENGIYIVSACGFDSIPADMGTVYLQKNFDGTLNSVETYLQVWNEGEKKGSVALHYGTWESAVYGLAHESELKPLRRKLYPERLPQFKPSLTRRSAIHKRTILEKQQWCVPFPGSDRSVVLRSQRHFFENEKHRPIQVQAYLALNSFFAIMALAFIGGIFALLAKFRCGRRLLLSYPRFFSGGAVSHEGPLEEDMKNQHFSITFYGEGWSSDKTLAEGTDQYVDPPNQSMIAKVAGVNPGYGFTCTALVLTALTVLKESDKMPDNGGVLPPGAAFAHTSLIEKLSENGVTFEIIKSEKL